MIAFLAAMAMAVEPRVEVVRPGEWWVDPAQPAGESPPAGGWRPVEGRVVASDADRIRATFRSGDFDVTLWVARADCARRIAEWVELAPKQGKAPAGVALRGGAPVSVGDADGDVVLVTYSADGILATGWVPAGAVDEVWALEEAPSVFGNLQASEPVALRTRPHGKVSAILGVGPDRFWTLREVGARGRWTEATLAGDHVEGHGWVRTADVSRTDEYAYGRGSGSGSFACADCTRISVPAGTQVRTAAGDVFAVAVEDGELLGEGPLVDGVVLVSVQTAWGAVPGRIACASIAADGACVSAP